jgi:hypothetical protein
MIGAAPGRPAKVGEMTLAPGLSHAVRVAEREPARVSTDTSFGLRGEH